MLTHRNFGQHALDRRVSDAHACGPRNVRAAALLRLRPFSSAHTRHDRGDRHPRESSRVPKHRPRDHGFAGSDWFRRCTIDLRAPASPIQPGVPPGCLICDMSRRLAPRMPPTLLREWLAALPEVPFFVMYGATEASARLTYLPPADLRRKVGSIGRPVSGVQRSTSSPMAAPSRPVARSANWLRVAQTSQQADWNDETATEQRFGANGFRNRRPRLQRHRRLSFHRRSTTRLLKIGGQRVAPQEIEHVLQQHPAVSEAVVVGAADDLLGERPVAFLVLREGMAADEASLRRFCAAHLAAAKVPSRVEFCRDLPRLGAGKA